MQTNKTLAGKLLILFGPSGVGKTTVLKALCARPNIKLRPLLTITTRAPRPAEQHGKHYNFVSQAEFLELQTSNQLFESAHFMGNFYATPHSELDALLQGQNLVVAVELAGLLQLQTLPQTIPVLLTAPLDVLRKRLAKRDQTLPETAITQRLTTDMAQLASAKQQVNFALTIENLALAGTLQQLERLLNLPN